MSSDYKTLINADPKDYRIKWYEWLWLWIFPTYVEFGEQVIFYKKAFGKLYILKYEDFPEWYDKY